MIEIAHFLRAYILPVLIICGFFLNMLSFFVMRRIKNSTTSNYMACLGLIDSGVLIIGALSLWVFTLNPDSSILINSQITCKLIPFLTYTFADMSVFIIVIMTAERFYAVWRPLQANKLGKKRKFRLSLIISIIICTSINCHFLLTHSLKEAPIMLSEKNFAKIVSQVDFLTEKVTNSIYTDDKQNQFDYGTEFVCVNIEWEYFYERYWLYIDATIYSFLPSVLLTIFNILIVRYFLKAADDSVKLNRHRFSYKSTISKSTLYNNKSHNKNSNLNQIQLHLNYLDHNNHNQDLINQGSMAYSFRPQNQLFKNGNFIMERACLNELKKSNTPPKMSSTLNRKNSMERVKFDKIDNTFSDTDSRNESLSYASLMTASSVSKTQALRRANARLTIILIALNITFCIFSMPMVILQIVYYSLLPMFGEGSTPIDSPAHFSSTLSPSHEAVLIDGKIGSARANIKDIDLDYKILEKMDLLKALAELLQYLNHSTNFVLYSFSGKTFRKETKMFIRFYLKKISSLFYFKTNKLITRCCKKRKETYRYSFNVST